VISRFKQFIRRAAVLAGGTTFAKSLGAGPVVLFYHGVEEQIIDPRIQSLHLPFQIFERQIEYLQSHFDIIPIDDLCRRLANGHILDRSQVVLTFDDGYRNNLHTVAPYLASRDIPFSVFVSTRHVDKGIRFPTYYLRVGIYCSNQRCVRIDGTDYDISTDDRKVNAMRAIARKLKTASQRDTESIVGEIRSLLSGAQLADLDARFSSDQPMTWQEVKQLRDFGATIGSHCHDHFILHANQNSEDIDFQLRTSKLLIEEQVGECRYIAYPNGTMTDVTPNVIGAVKDSGYLAGLTTVPAEMDIDADPFLLPRVCGDIYEFAQFKFAINSCHRHNGRYKKWLDSMRQ